MAYRLFRLLSASFLASASLGGETGRFLEISADRIKTHVAYLANDPGFPVAAGTRTQGKPKDSARKALQGFNDKVYHSPPDALPPQWGFSGFVVWARFALDRARDFAEAGPRPTWNPGDDDRLRHVRSSA